MAGSSCLFVINLVAGLGQVLKQLLDTVDVHGQGPVLGLGQGAHLNAQLQLRNGSEAPLHCIASVPCPSKDQDALHGSSGT